MIARLRYLWRQHRGLSILFALLLATTLALMIRSAMFAVYWDDPARRDQVVQGWMTPRYVAHSWRLPPDVLHEALELDRMPGPRRTLADLAAERGVPVQALIDALEAAISAHRAAGPRQ